MNTAALRTSTKLCKDSITAIRHFITLGLHPGGFCTALLLRDEQAVWDRAHPVLKSEGVVPEMIEWVAANVPQGLFQRDDDIVRWVEIGGIKGAPENERFMLYMMSTWWKPAARAFVEDARP